LRTHERCCGTFKRGRTTRQGIAKAVELPRLVKEKSWMSHL